MSQRGIPTDRPMREVPQVRGRMQAVPGPTVAGGRQSGIYSPTGRRRTPGQEAVRKHSEEAIQQVAELWKRLEQVEQDAQRRIEVVQIEAERERSKVEMLLQDNERLQRRVDELSLAGSCLNSVVNGSAQAEASGRSQSADASLTARAPASPPTAMRAHVGCANIAADMSARYLRGTVVSQLRRSQTQRP